jgi:DNA-binding NarL/FixJ family response regulator
VLRAAEKIWQDLDVPYEAARVRVLIGVACRDLGDDDIGGLELAAARRAFEHLGARPDVARVGELSPRPAPTTVGGLSARELEVLRLVAAGKSNREIASALVISEHTVRRHLQNLFAKIGVSSRSAATAFAFQHDLL